jgi:hypothetical protein
MAIMTVAEIKALLGITDSTYDTIFAAWLPVVQDDILTYCGTCKFRDKNIYIKSNLISFADADPDTIADAQEKFVTTGFEAGMDILVEDSLSNDGCYTIDTVVAATITLISTDELATEAAGARVFLSRVKWPKGIQKYVAQMVWYGSTSAKSVSASSESIGDYSVTYGGNNSTSVVGGYPDEILKGLNKWKCTKLV